MSVPEYILMQAWDKAGGQCECKRFSHNHPYVRCTRKLSYDKRGLRAPGGWAPRYRTSPTTHLPLSCEILCLECYEMERAEEFKRQL